MLNKTVIDPKVMGIEMDDRILRRRVIDFDTRDSLSAKESP
jgi:hypothetical protein